MRYLYDLATLLALPTNLFRQQVITFWTFVENPKPRSKGDYKTYGEWLQQREALNFQDKLLLAKRPGDLAAFLTLMEQAGYEIKKVRGGGLSFRLAGQGQERFTRLRISTLGEGYDLKIYWPS